MSEVKVNKSPVQDVEILEEYIPSRPVKIRDRQGNLIEYRIEETSGGAEFWKWLDRLTAMSENVEKKKVVDWSELQCDLIVQCIRKDLQPVPRETIMGWGKALKQRLYDICMEMNGMGRDSADKMGKDSGDGDKNGGGSPSPSE